MIGAVLDTNVVVYGILSEHGPPGRILDLLVAGELTAVYDNRILTEYRDVLTRSKLNLDGNRVRMLLITIQDDGVAVIPMPWRVPLPDLDDEPFLACAKMSAAPLVTGNLRHYPKRLRFGVSVLSPAQA